MQADQPSPRSSGWMQSQRGQKAQCLLPCYHLCCHKHGSKILCSLGQPAPCLHNPAVCPACTLPLLPTPCLACPCRSATAYSHYPALHILLVALLTLPCLVPAFPEAHRELPQGHIFQVPAPAAAITHPESGCIFPCTSSWLASVDKPQLGIWPSGPHLCTPYLSSTAPLQPPVCLPSLFHRTQAIL